MNNSIFYVHEIVSYLSLNNKSFASQAFEIHFPTKTIKHQDTIHWFQRHFGREQAYKLFREMECHVSQCFLFENA